MRRFGVALITGLLPAVVSAQNGGGFTAGSRDVFVLDLSSVPAGEFPKQLKQLKGAMTVVQKDGKPMLKAANASEFLITLPEVLPADFTLEFALVPKAGISEDLSFEGTRQINQGTASAHIIWDSDAALQIVGGAADNYESPMPEELRTTLPGVLTQVNVSFTGNTVKLYTNGRRLYTLERQFARGRVLRVSLGGVDEPNGAVYLAGLRIASNMPARRFWSEDTDFQPAQRTLFDLNAPPPPPPPPGKPPEPRPGIRVQKGAWTRVQMDGMRMFKVSQPTELLVSLLEPLPQDFTVEFEIVPKECCPPPDLSFEGTSAIDQGDRSAHLLWQADGALAVIGGKSNDNYETPMPEDFKVILPGVPTEVAASFQGGTIKLYTNGRRLYTLTGRQFVRGKVLRVFLGGQNATDQAVYLAKLRIATNAAPPAGVGSETTTNSNASSVTETTSPSSPSKITEAPATSASTPSISNVVAVVGPVADGSCITSWCPDWRTANGACERSWCPDWRTADGACITSWCPDWRPSMSARKVTWSWKPPAGVATAMATFYLLATDQATGQTQTTRLTERPVRLSSGWSIAVVAGTAIRFCVAALTDPSDPARLVAENCVDTRVPTASP